MTSPASKNSKAGSKAKAAKSEDMRINLHVLIDVDPAKWAVEDQADAPEPEAIAKALETAGIDAGKAAQLAAKAVKAEAGTSHAAVRDGIREYVLAEMRKLAKLAEAGAKVAYYERPVR